MVRISVAMATYNGARYIAEQLESICCQERMPDELVVSDDGSTDGTLDIVAQFQRRFSVPIRIRQNANTLGSTKNFEAAILECEGDIIALSDQDDVWMPGKLGALEQAFGPDVGLIFTDAEMVDENLKPLGYTLWRLVDFNHRDRAKIQAQEAYDLLLRRSFVTGATLAFRSELRDLILPFPLQLSDFIHDRWSAVLSAAVARLSSIDRPLVKYRQHTTQQFGEGPKTMAQITFRGLKGGKANLQGDLLAISTLRQRLFDDHGWSAHQEFLDALDRRERHITQRLHLPRSRFFRLAPVARELAAGRYHRCSSGLLSAAKDLLL